MSHRGKIGYLMLLALIGVFVSFVLYYLELGRIADSVAQVLIIYSVAHLLVLVVLMMVTVPIFRSWKKLVFVYMPVALVLIVITSESSGFMQPDREIVTWLTAGGFVVISLTLIAYKQIRLKRG